MGLQLTLDKTKNLMYYTFIDAYWAISEPTYTTELIDFSLRAYPNREAKLMNNQRLDNPSIGYGSGASAVSCILYEWHVVMDLRVIFPDGVIPAGRDAQYTAIYNWIKEYTQLPFTDVFELE